MARDYSFHNKAANYLLLGMALGRRFYADQYFLQDQQTVFDQYSTGASAAIKLAYNVVGPVIFAYAAAATHEAISRRKTRQRTDAMLDSDDDLEASRRQALLDPAQDPEDPAAEQKKFRFNQTRAYMVLGFSALLAQVPTMIQGFSSNPDPETVLQTERVAALNPVIAIACVGLMHGVTDFIFNRQQVSAMTFSATSLLSAKLGPLLFLPAIAIHNMKGLEVFGKTMGPWGMLAFTGLLPAALATTKVTAVSKALNKPVFKRNAGLITALCSANYVSEWLFGNLGNVLQLTNHTYAAREESKFGMLLLSQIALMAVTTGIVLLGKKVIDSCEASRCTMRPGGVRDGE